MLNLKLAQCYVDLSVNRRPYDTVMAALKSEITGFNRTINVNVVINDQVIVGAIKNIARFRAIAAAPIKLNVQLDRQAFTAAASLIRQQTDAMQRRSFGTIPVRADLRPWRTSVQTIALDILRLKNSANLSLITNTTPARVNLDLAIQRIRALRSAAATPVTLNLRVDRTALTAAMGLVRQQTESMQRRSFGTIPIRADLRPWRAAIQTVAFDILRLKNFARISLITDTARAHANINLLIQQLRAAQGMARLNITSNRAHVGLNQAGGGRGGWSGGTGFVGGAAMGVGLPYASSPQMMAGEMVGKGLVAIVKTSADLEHEFAVLRRITNMTSSQIGDFKQSIIKLSTSQPGVATHELIEMAQIGGRAGIAEREGPKGLEAFVGALAKVKNIVTDIPVEKLANDVTKVLNEFELGTERVAGFGSALAAMDNASTASARDLLAITQGFGGTAHAIRMTLPQTIAFASVLKDVGLTNQLAASSFSQIFRLMARDHEKFAKLIGMDGRTFKEAYERDAMEALGMVISKFKEFQSTVEGQTFLGDLGLKGVRAAGAIQQLAAKFPEVQRRAAIASEETGSTKSLVAGDKIMSDTTSAAFQRTGNSLVDLADASGSVLAPAARAASDALTDMASGLASVIRGTNRVSFAGGPADAAKKAVEALPAKAEPVAPATPETVQAAKDAQKVALDEMRAIEDRLLAQSKVTNEAQLARNKIKNTANPDAWMAAQNTYMDSREKEAAIREEGAAATKRYGAATDNVNAAQQKKGEDDRADAFREKWPLRRIVEGAQSKVANVRTAVQTAVATIGPQIPKILPALQAQGEAMKSPEGIQARLADVERRRGEATKELKNKPFDNDNMLNAAIMPKNWINGGLTKNQRTRFDEAVNGGKDLSKREALLNPSMAAAITEGRAQKGRFDAERASILASAGTIYRPAQANIAGGGTTMVDRIQQNINDAAADKNKDKEQIRKLTEIGTILGQIRDNGAKAVGRAVDAFLK